MKKVLFVVVALLIGFAPSAWSQTNVILVPGSATCVPINITLGSQYTFSRGPGCTTRSLAVATRLGSVKKETSGLTLAYTFDEVGVFDVFCDVPATVFDGVSVETAEVCYNVQRAQTIPTMGEWGLIALSLILMIFSVQAILQKNESPSFE